MNLDQPLEALLRPPLEWYSSAIAALGCFLLLFYANVFLLPNDLARWVALLLGIFTLIRFRQGYRIYRYKRNLKRMPTYTMTSKQLPVSAKGLFLGRGFQWTPLHAQRLRDLDLPYNLKYRNSSALYRALRNMEINNENKTFFNTLTKFTRHASWLNPFRPYPDIGGEPCLHGVGEKEKNIWLNNTERAGHTIVIGTTGVGKTRFAEIVIGQDIRRGDVVIVLDPKGDSDLLKRIFIEAKMSNREKDVVVFHLGFPESSARYNPIGSFTKITQVATRVTNGLPSSGEAASFKEFAWKYVNLVAKALVAMNVRPTYKLIHFYITKLDQLFFRYVEEILAKADPNFENSLQEFIQENTKVNKEGVTYAVPTREDAIFAYVQAAIDKRNLSAFNTIANDLLTDLFTACRLDKTYYDKITASVGPLLEKLTTGAIGDLLSPNYMDINDERPIFDWLQVIRHKKIVYIGMDAMTDSVVSSAVGNACLSDLVSVAGYLYKFNIGYGFERLDEEIKNAPIVRLHTDEFNEIIGDEFIPILNKARGAGFNVTAYTQTWSDVQARLGSIAKAGQVAGNFNTVVMFRTKEAATVEMLLAQLPKIPILRVIPASSSNDAPHGEGGIYYQSANEDRFAHTDVRPIEQNDILNLPKGQAYCLLEGGKLFKLRMPMPKFEGVVLPISMMDLIEKMQARQINQQSA